MQTDEAAVEPEPPAAPADDVRTPSLRLAAAYQLNHVNVMAAGGRCDADR